MAGETGDFGIVASLNIAATLKILENDLKKIESQLKPIQISAQLNTENIKSQTAQVQQQINQAIKIAPEKVDLGANLDLSSLTKSGTTIKELSDKVALLAQQMQILQARAENAGVTLNQIQVGKFTDLLNNFKIPEATTYLKELRNEYSLLNVEMSKDLPETAIENMNVRAEKLSRDIDVITSKFSQVHLDNQPGFANQVNQTTVNVQKLQENLDKFNSAKVGPDKVSAFNELNKSVAEAKVQVNDLFKAQKDLDRLSATSNRFEAFLNDNVKVAKQFPDAVAKIRSELQGLNSETDMTKLNSGLQNVRGQISALEASAKSVGATGRTIFGELGNDIKKMLTWTVGGTLIFGTVNQIKQLYTSVNALDDQMVELRKVTDETETTYNEFYHTANDVAKSLGVQTESVISSTAAWAQMGYNIKDASDMAKDSEIFKNISENMDVTEATNTLISTMKAFKIDSNDALDGIISKVNEVGNKFAVTNKDIADGLERSSSAMAVANNSMDETIALLTSAIEITRDADAAGTALRTISMRIRGMDEDTGEASDDLKEMAKSIKGLTGVTIFTDNTQQTYKSTYEILKEISKVYDNLSDKKQAEVLELLAGKRQGNVVASMLTNFQSAEKALEVQANSAGGALREQDTYMDSISAHANKFKETLVGIGQNVIDTTEVKKAFDILTGLLNVLDSVVSKLGTVPTLIAAVSAAFSLTNRSAGRFKLYAPFLKVA